MSGSKRGLNDHDDIVHHVSSPSPAPSEPQATVTVTASPTPQPSLGGMPVAGLTLTVALLAALAAIYGAYLQRRTGKETVAVARRAAAASEVSAEASKISSEASGKSAQAAERSVALNERTALGVASRAEAEALLRRYQDAAGQLGHDSAAVRFAGVYGLSNLADEWQAQRYACVEVLCAYLRMPVRKLADGSEDLSDWSVRRCIQRVIREHLQVDSPTSWSNMRFNFRGAQLDSFWLVKAIFERRVEFDGATLTGRSTSLRGTQFREGASMRRVRIETALNLAPSEVGSGIDLSDSVVAMAGELTIRYKGGSVAGQTINVSRLQVDRGSVDIQVGNTSTASDGVRLIARDWSLRLPTSVVVQAAEGEGDAPSGSGITWDLGHRP